MMAHKATHGWTAHKDDDDGAPHAVETQPNSEATTLTSPTSVHDICRPIFTTLSSQ